MKLKKVKLYIQNQKEQHGHVGYQDELRAIFEAYGMEWNEIYVWDQYVS